MCTAVRIRGNFPSDTPATKLIYLALYNVEETWTSARIAWHAARALFTVELEGRLTINGRAALPQKFRHSSDAPAPLALP